MISEDEVVAIQAKMHRFSRMVESLDPDSVTPEQEAIYIKEFYALRSEMPKLLPPKLRLAFVIAKPFLLFSNWILPQSTKDWIITKAESWRNKK